MVDEFQATIAGATVAGLIGILTLIVQQRLDTRRKQNEEILAPVFNYVLKLPEFSPFEGMPEFPWDRQEPYPMLKVAIRYSRPIRELSSKLKGRSESYGAYWTFVSGKRGENIESAFESALIEYVDLDGHFVDVREMGMADAGRVDARWVFHSIFPYIVKNLGFLERTWSDVMTSTYPNLYWARVVVSWLKTNDPDQLQKLATYVLGERGADDAKPLVESLLHDHESVLAQAEVVRRLLARRLGIENRGQ